MTTNTDLNEIKVVALLPQADSLESKKPWIAPTLTLISELLISNGSTNHVAEATGGSWNNS